MPGFDGQLALGYSGRAIRLSRKTCRNIISAKNVLAKVRNAFSMPAFAPVAA